MVFQNHQIIELARIAEIVHDYISTVRFDNALNYPVYPNSSHLTRMESIAKSLSTFGQRNLKTEESYRHFLGDLGFYQVHEANA